MQKNMKSLINRWNNGVMYITNNLTASDYSSFWSYIISINEHNLDVNEYIFETSKVSGEILDICIDFKYTNSKVKAAKTLLYSKFIATKVVKDVIRAFDRAIEDIQENKTSNPLFYFDSLHDSNLIAIINLLGIDYTSFLPFATSLFFELREDDVNGKMFVRVYLDEEELDVNIMARSDRSDNTNEQHHKHPKYYQKQLYDEPDQESSYYYYLKRYLLRRVFTEDVESYCDKSMDDIIFMEFNIREHSVKRDRLFLISVILCSTFFISLAFMLGFCIYSRVKRTQRMTIDSDGFLTERKFKVRHARFVDEDDLHA